MLICWAWNTLLTIIEWSKDWTDTFSSLLIISCSSRTGCKIGLSLNAGSLSKIECKSCRTNYAYSLWRNIVSISWAGIAYTIQFNWVLSWAWLANLLSWIINCSVCAMIALLNSRIPEVRKIASNTNSSVVIWSRRRTNALLESRIKGGSWWAMRSYCWCFILALICCWVEESIIGAFYTNLVVGIIIRSSWAAFTFSIN